MKKYLEISFTAIVLFTAWSSIGWVLKELLHLVEENLEPSGILFYMSFTALVVSSLAWLLGAVAIFSKLVEELTKEGVE